MVPSCKAAGNIKVEDKKTVGTPVEETLAPFYRVIVQLRIDSNVKDREQAHMKRSIAEARAALFRDLGSCEYRVNRVFDTIPFVALEVSPSALKALKKSAIVEGIVEDSLSTTQSP